MTLENEAEEYEFKESGASSKLECHIATKSFIAGANSNYAKQQVIKGKIEVLQEIARENKDPFTEFAFVGKILKYKDELKQLQKL